jgi:phosphoribosylaminoimidazolecarboxamide formyltransferase / IMP cyclohydrolase
VSTTEQELWASFSVTDKTGLEKLAAGLAKWRKLMASGGTAKAISAAGIEVTDISKITGFPEMMGGRLKTMHPLFLGPLLANRAVEEDLEAVREHGMVLTDVLVGNLYDFAGNPSIEQIDIGGPTQIRSAAKNFESVAVLVDPNDYDDFLAEMDANNGFVSLETRERLAAKAFAYTASYDAAIANWWAAQQQAKSGAALPSTHHIALVHDGNELRYGENPHQAGARFREVGTKTWLDTMVQHQGLKLSYLNLLDAEAAWRLAYAISTDKAVAAIIKHANPCGYALREGQAEAYRLAFSCDEQSAFGGIVAFNRPLTLATAELMFDAAQADVVIAPSYEEGVIDVLRKKRKNTRLLEAQPPEPIKLDIRQLGNSFLVQEPHHFAALRADWKVVTERQPTEQEWDDAELAHILDGYVKSNSIVMVEDGVAWGIGAGQQKRVDSAKIAAEKSGGRAKGGAVASDAFFPFADGLEAAAAGGATTAIQPGGSMNDDEVIAKANELKMAMIFTGERHFLH